MKHIARNSWHLIIGISGISALAWFMHSYPPSNALLVTIFFIILLLSSTFLLYYLLNNVRRSLLLAVGLVIFFALRALDLRDPIYLGLLGLSLVSLELLLQKR